MSAAESSTLSGARYQFGDGTRGGVLLGLSLRQGAPIVAGTVWFTVAMMATRPLVGLVGVAASVVVAFGRWRRAPLYDVAVPGVRLGWGRLWRRQTWARRSLLGTTGSTVADQLPAVMAGLELLEASVEWSGTSVRVGVVRDRPAGTVSMVIGVLGDGFASASPLEQDAALAGWGGALAPLARERCPVVRVTWQEWAHTVGVATHRQFLTELGARPSTVAAGDYDELLGLLDPSTIAHDVLVTVTVDLRRVRARGRDGVLDAAIAALSGEVSLLAARLTAAGLVVTTPLSPVELATAIRVRSDPARTPTSVATSLAAAAGRRVAEWGPMAVEADWQQVRVDGSMHRSYRVVGWPMLPVGADWMAPLLTGGGQTRTVTVVLEPTPLKQAVRAANRQLTSLETDRDEKSRKGFRATARERRRIEDVEARERELAAGHPEFGHVGFVTVTASTFDELEEACVQVEQDAAQAMLDIRPLAARQAEGWVASLPVGRSIRRGVWS